MSNPLPAREEAWNCNRCRDTGAIVWNFEVFRCENGCPVRLGPLPLQGTEATIGGTSAGPDSGRSHDTDRWAHENAWCRGGPDCLCEPEGL